MIVILGGTLAPGGRRKYKRLVLSEGLSSAANVVFFPNQDTCHDPHLCLVLLSSCHSTIITLVPSFPLFGSNSNLASAVTESRVSLTVGDRAMGGSTSDATCAVMLVRVRVG